MDANTPARDGSKTVVAHSHTLVRQALSGMVDRLGFGPVLEADSAQSLLAAVSRHRPEMVLMDSNLGADLEDAVAAIVSRAPKPSVVVLVPPESHVRAEAALRAGANGCLSLNVTAEELGDTLRLLHRGGVVVSGEIASVMHAQEPQPIATGGLSGREREVLGLVASGATNREIAEALVVTENTVKVHLRNVLDKLKLRNRQQAVAFAVREGMITEIQTEV